MEHQIVFLPGDGIGPEVATAARRILETTAAQFGLGLKITEALIGGAAYDATGTPLPEETLEKCKKASAVFLGAVGGPKWDTAPQGKRPESGLLALRKGMGVFANLRPVSVYPELAGFSCLRSDRIAEGVDLVVVRELTGDIYFGEHHEETRDNKRYAHDVMAYDEEEIRRIAHIGFQTAKTRRGTICSVDKANVLAVSRLWRAVVTEVSREYPDVALEHMYVDNAAMQLAARPACFDVILTGNLFGDILSDLAASLTGSLGMLSSASLGTPGSPGLYEPAHGSAPDIAGRDIANPLASILSVALMLRMSLNAPEAADAVERAVQESLRQGRRTADLISAQADAVPLGCAAMTRQIISLITAKQ